MIHISNNVYLQDAGYDGNPIIGYQSIVTSSNVEADSSDADFPVVNLANEQTHQYWVSDSTSTQYVYINQSSSVVDYVGIARHNFGTGGIAYQLQGSDGSSPEVWSNITTEKTPSNDTAIIEFFDAATYARFRLKLTPASTEPQIAHIKLGTALVLQRSIYVGHKPVTLNRRTDVIRNTSENGQFLGIIQKRQYLMTSVDMDLITPAFYRTYVDPFVEHAITGAFFFAWRPVGYPLEVGYGWTDGDISPKNDKPNGMMAFSFNMKAVS